MTEKDWGVDMRSSPVEADPRFSRLGRTVQVDWGAFSKRQMVLS
jgi:hypothetical protein